MPGHYNMPAIPNRYPLDKNDKLGLAIGALLSGGIAAANSNRNMGENPLLRGLEGGLVGFGAGGKAINDSYSAMLDDYLKGEDMNFKNREFGQKSKEYEESERPYREAMTNWYNQREETPVDYNKIRDERVKRRLDIRLKQKELGEEKPVKMPDVGSYGKLKAQLAGLKASNNIDYLGMPADERARTIADLENTIRLMEQYQPDLKPPQSNQQIPQQGDVMSRHQNDPAMQGTELGKLTPQGYEVYKNGKLVGHYQ